MTVTEDCAVRPLLNLHARVKVNCDLGFSEAPVSARLKERLVEVGGRLNWVGVSAAVARATVGSSTVQEALPPAPPYDTKPLIFILSFGLIRNELEPKVIFGEFLASIVTVTAVVSVLAPLPETVRESK